LEYLKINNTDYSGVVKELKIATNANYTSQTNAAGNTVVDYINSKRVITVGFIPMSETKLLPLLADIDAFNVSLSFRNPRTNAIENNVECIAAKNTIEYYTIQQGNVSYKAFSIDFTEL
jgi:hypothetical protein